MRIKCIHGYFIFEESYTGEASQFATRFNGPPIARVGEHFTFKPLSNASRYSIKGQDYLGAIATETFAGTPWEIMRANKLVFNFATGLVVPIATVTQVLEVSDAGAYYTSPGLILPGALLQNGSRVTDYVGWYVMDKAAFRYTQLGVE